MSLDTILAIGTKIRKMDKALEYHRYVRKAPILRMQGKKEIHYKHFKINVNEQFEIDIESFVHHEDEDLIKQKFYYLAYRTSEADTYVKYIFGDICSDYFKFADTSKKGDYAKNSFDRGIGDAAKVNSPVIEAFRSNLSKSLDTILTKIEASIQEGEKWYIHFDFSGKSWYELTETFEKINEAILGNFIKTDKENNISLSAFLVRTLIESEGALPGFDLKNSYKTKRFENIEEVKNLLYGIGFGLKHKIREDDIKINLLPKGDDLTGEDIVDFFKPKKDSDEQKYQITGQIDLDDLLAPGINDNKNIISYDIVFSKESKPIGIDILELKDVEKNQLRKVQQKITKVLIKMEEEGFFRENLNIRFSLKNIFDKQKYKKHLLKVLPLIYKDAYREDLVLLPAFLQKCEYGVRNEDKYKTYPYLKRYFYFLMKLQKYDNMIKITETQSYQLGLQLGLLAQPFSGGRIIKSFEKNYVGNLLRRITNIDDLVAFSNYINEKLTIHNKAYPNLKQAFLVLNEIVDSMDEKYDKNHCAFGFFKSYYTFGKPEEKNTESDIVETNS